MRQAVCRCAQAEQDNLRLAHCNLTPNRPYTQKNEEQASTMETNFPRIPADSTAAVDRYMAELNHPHIEEVQALRTLILGINPAIGEGIKWNAPSYRLVEYFATTNLRVKGGVGIILHLGAKVRQIAVQIDDPEKLLTWHGPNRASFVVHDMEALRARTPALKTILAQWLRYV